MNKQRLTRRGKIVLGLILAIAIYYVATHIWLTPAGYCFDTIDACLAR